jgi:hypothetical protein
VIPRGHKRSTKIRLPSFGLAGSYARFNKITVLPLACWIRADFLAMSASGGRIQSCPTSFATHNIYIYIAVRYYSSE